MDTKLKNMMEMWELEREELIKENQRLQLQVHQLKAQREALREQLQYYQKET